MALSCKQIFWLSSIICGGEITHPTHQWGVVAIEQILIHSTETCCRISSYRKQWMDLITTSSPTSFFSTPRTPTGRMLSNKHVSEVSMQMAGSVCSFAYNYHFFYICILPLTNVLENAFYFLSTKNTWITSWFGQEHTTTILCPLSSLFYDVTSCGVLSHHRTTWT